MLAEEQAPSNWGHAFARGTSEFILLLDSNRNSIPIIPADAIACRPNRRNSCQSRALGPTEDLTPSYAHAPLTAMSRCPGRGRDTQIDTAHGETAYFRGKTVSSRCAAAVVENQEQELILPEEANLLSCIQICSRFGRRRIPPCLLRKSRATLSLTAHRLISSVRLTSGLAHLQSRFLKRGNWRRHVLSAGLNGNIFIRVKIDARILMALKDRICRVAILLRSSSERILFSPARRSAESTQRAIAAPARPTSTSTSSSAAPSPEPTSSSPTASSPSSAITSLRLISQNSARSCAVPGTTSAWGLCLRRNAGSWADDSGSTSSRAIP